MYASILFLFLLVNPLNGLDSLMEKKKPPLILVTNELIDHPDNYIIIYPSKNVIQKKKKRKYRLKKSR